MTEVHAHWCVTTTGFFFILLEVQDFRSRCAKLSDMETRKLQWALLSCTAARQGATAILHLDIKRCHLDRYLWHFILTDTTETIWICSALHYHMISFSYENKIMYAIYSTFVSMATGIIFHILTGSCRFCSMCPRSCKMMFPISYLVYCVNYFTCLLKTYLVYNENYHVCLLIIRTNHSGG